MFQFEWTKKHTVALIYVCVTILLAILLLFMLIFPGGLLRFFGGLFNTLSPVFAGFAIAYLLNPIVDFLEKKPLRVLNRKKPMPRATRLAAIFLAFLLVTALLTLFIAMVVPQVKASYLDLEARFDDYLQNASAYLEKLLADFVVNDAPAFPLPLGEDGESGTVYFGIESLFDYLGDLIESSFDIVGRIVNTALTYSSKLLLILGRAIISVVFACLFLYKKEFLLARISTLSQKILPKKAYDGARRWIACTDQIFGGFISGKILDSVIILFINFAVFSLCGIPYAPLIALINGVTNIIPYFGPIIGAIPSAFIILIADPVKVIWFILLTLVIQQLDGNVIGPKILGDKVGVNSLMVIVAITVGGGLFGLAGMFFGVPVFAVIRLAFKDFTEFLLKKRGLPTSLSAYTEKTKEAGK